VVQKDKDNTWKPAVIGGDFVGSALAKLRAQSMGQTRKPASAYHAVSIPALNAHFLAYDDDANLKLIPVIDYPEYELKAGEPVDATTVVPKLMKAAQSHDGAPR
jgi:hypothetical protein